MTPCESCPTRLAPTMWRMTSAASSLGVPAASNSARPISSRRSAAIFGILGPSLWSCASGGLFDVGRPHQAQRFGVAHRRHLRVLKEVLVFLGHRRRHHLDHQPVFQPELDDVEKRLLALHAAAEGLGAPALARPDALDL